jgi:hypothetical protein
MPPRNFTNFEHNRLAAPPYIKSYPVEVRPSEGKGNGVFATRNIPRGTVVCWYDGIMMADSAAALLITGKQGYNQLVNDFVVAGFPEMMHKGGCAQLINDYATEYEEGDLKYRKHINVNIDFGGAEEMDGGRSSIAFITTKKIKKGSELFYHYGQGYWNARRLRMATMNIEDDYVLAVMAIVLDQAEGSDSEAKLLAYHLYREAREKTGIEGYKARHAIVSSLSHLTRLV